MSKQKRKQGVVMRQDGGRQEIVKHADKEAGRGGSMRREGRGWEQGRVEEGIVAGELLVHADIFLI